MQMSWSEPTPWTLFLINNQSNSFLNSIFIHSCFCWFPLFTHSSLPPYPHHHICKSAFLCFFYPPTLSSLSLFALISGTLCGFGLPAHTHAHINAATMIRSEALCVRAKKQCLSFRTWVTSFSIVFSPILPIFLQISLFWFALQLNKIPLFLHIFINHLLVDGHVGWFPFLSIVNRTEMNLTYGYQVFEYEPRSGIAGSYSNSYDYFLKNYYTDFYNSYVRFL